MLVGNKSDLENIREVSFSDVQELIKEYDITDYIETSSKTGFNSKQLFINVAKLLCENYNEYKNNCSLSEYSRNTTLNYKGISSKISFTLKENFVPESKTEKKACC